jgi:hypothetical protein
MTEAIDTITATPTQEVLAAMMIENTGRHILDSGGAYGRSWERNQGLTVEDWIKSPRVTIGSYGDVTLSTFHYLDENLTYSPDLDRAFQGFSAGSNGSYLEDIAEFIELIGATTSGGENSYNSESNLSQVIQWTSFTIGENNYMALQVHGGADVRGGYTKPRIFEPCEEYLVESLSLYCSVDRSHYLDTSGGGEWTDHNGNYNESPYSLHDKAKDRGELQGIACPEDNCMGLLQA